MSGDRKRVKIVRLNRIAGQVQGLARMVSEDRYCLDILHQIQAVKAALGRAEARSCVITPLIASPLQSPAAARQSNRQKLNELVDLFDRARR